MSLRRRLLLALAIALLISFGAGAWITAWQAAQLVRAEVQAALNTGAGGASAVVPSQAALTRLVSGFDGSRHVVAELLIGGKLAARSRPSQPADRAPAWFARMADPALAPMAVPFPGGLLRLLPAPASETAERWSEARRLIGMLALSSGLSAMLCLTTAAWSLRWLSPLSAAFAVREAGGAAAAVAERGPPEIAGLGAAFNRMQDSLTRTARENRRLAARLARLAEEERAELSRDLHDEIGPLLFAVTAWAAAARLQGDAGDHAAATASLGSLSSAAADLQRSVRGLLGRLRDSEPAVTDLPQSLDELVIFWRDVRPQTGFALCIDDLPAASDAIRAVLFRVAQEGVSNAIRHADPGQVRIAVSASGAGLSLTVEDDGRGGADDGAGSALGDGLGLVGMEERLQSLGGTLSIERGEGWALTAWVPLDRVRGPA